VFLNILVAPDGSPSARVALQQAIDLARSQNSALTLITVAPPVAQTVTLAGMSREAMEAELDTWAKNVLDEAAASVPDDLDAAASAATSTSTRRWHSLDTRVATKGLSPGSGNSPM
jgi:nucleotide-binding universal stress UspA family protein